MAPVDLGPIHVPTPVVLSPMAGVTNWPFRVLCEEYGPDGLYVAVAVQNLDGTVDVTVGRWSGTHIINKKVIYKNIGDTVSRMLFSPNSLRLYVEGPLNASGRPTSATVLEFS